MTNVPRYTTLRDYLRVIKAQRWLILASIVVFAAIAFALSESQTKHYEATASLSFRDVGSDLNLLGVNTPPQTTGEEQAAAAAQLINRPAIAIRVKQRL